MTAQVRVALWDRALRRVRETQEATLLGFVRHAAGHRDRQALRLLHDPPLRGLPRARAARRLRQLLARLRAHARRRAERPVARAHPLLRQQLRQLQQGQAASSSRSPTGRSATSAEAPPTRVYRYLGARGETRLHRRLHARPLPADHDEEGRARRGSPPTRRSSRSRCPLRQASAAARARTSARSTTTTSSSSGSPSATSTTTSARSPGPPAGSRSSSTSSSSRRAPRATDVDSVREIWPNLRVLVGGGVSADPYLPVLRERMGRDDFVLVDTYNATEGGIFATTDHSGEPGMLMIPDRGVFFEFVPVEERRRPVADAASRCGRSRRTASTRST